jgi:hypothetical protein
MFEDLFICTGGGLLVMPIAAMLFFLAVFAAVLVRVLSGPPHFDRMARLPLDDDDGDGDDGDGARERAEVMR